LTKWFSVLRQTLRDAVIKERSPVAGPPSESAALQAQLPNVGLESLHARNRLEESRKENEALRAQLHNVGLEFIDARNRLEESRKENEALRAQLHNVGLEFIDASNRLEESRREKESPHAQLDEVPLEVIEVRNQLEESRKENEALRAQAHNVGLEFIDARKRLEAIEIAKNAHVSELGRAYQNRRSLIVVPRVTALLPEGESFVIVDGGAREIDRDPRWIAFPPNRLKFFGFEPDPAEAERLNALPLDGGSERKFYPAGLWGETGTQTFEHNFTASASTFLRQNRAVTDRWKFENPSQAVPSPDMFYPVRYEELPVISLADWAKKISISSLDFLKLNVQGGELEVLRGAGPLLDTTLGMLIEVAFVESYHNRPMFADIDCYLRDRGFTFFDLIAHHYTGRAVSPIAAQHLSVVKPKFGELVSAWGQLIEGHALYFYDPIGKQSAMEPVRVLKLAALTEAFGQIEFSIELLEWLRQRVDVRDTPLGQALKAVVEESSACYETLLPRRNATAQRS
jgi:FkbM family methyltransferase